mmetsp:Transcript_13264/g.31844  ORF Transcript_13264/g.31844 Transcript_13264/m.31844 type:complete len:82 (-) Transcript_13264:7-252(-)
MVVDVFLVARQQRTSATKGTMMERVGFLCIVVSQGGVIMKENKKNRMLAPRKTMEGYWNEKRLVMVLTSKREASDETSSLW